MKNPEDMDIDWMGIDLKNWCMADWQKPVPPAEKVVDDNIIWTDISYWTKGK